MEPNEEIARITLESRKEQVIRINFRRNSSVKFRCQRCAVFCCRLGGPKLSSSDIESLKQIGKNPNTTVDHGQMTLRSKQDGSCLFLEIDSKNGLYGCSIYEHRPYLCRFYPFEIIKLNADSCALRLIPCCNGLNTHDGEVVDHKFIINQFGRILANLSDPKAVAQP